MFLHFNGTDIRKSGDQAQFVFAGIRLIRQTKCHITGHNMLDADGTENPVCIRMILCLNKKCLIVLVDLVLNLQTAQTFYFLRT